MVTSVSTVYERFNWIRVAQVRTNLYIKLVLSKKSRWKELTNNDKRRFSNFLTGRGSPQEKHCAMS
jgi:hypothetical protein